MIWQGCKLPSSVEEGSRAAAGGALNKINRLTNTTPALRAAPPQLRRGAFQFIHTFIAPAEVLVYQVH